MTSRGLAISLERIDRSILLIRGQRVMLDVDLARVYGVTKKRLTEQVRRNRARFPADFMFVLTRVETLEVAANCGDLRGLKFSPSLPMAFTEHGAVMLASVLSSPTAVRASIEVVRAFIRLRHVLATHAELARRIDALERKYDAQFRSVFDAIRSLMEPPAPPRPRIGFHPGR